MRDLLRRLIRLEGTVSRGTYVACGLIGFAVKFAIDSSIASAFGRHWSPVNYWYLAGAKFQPRELVVLFVVALPFIWFGVTMTLLRARDAGITPFTIIFFFFPLLNLVYFAVLMARPSVVAVANPSRAQTETTKAVESAVLAVLLTTAISIVFGALSTWLFESYGLMLFVGLPFVIGFTSAVIHGYRYPRSLSQVILVSCVSLFLVAGGFVAFAWEGILCLAMAFPIAVALTVIGALFGYVVQLRGRPAVAACVPIVLPLLLVLEPAQPPLTAVRTSIEIEAPASEVWRNVIAFSDIADAPEWLFRTGIAYPLRARIRGHGPGAVRYCIFTTGAFVEPIDVWDEPHRLGFAVTHTPAPMDELSPYASVRPPHLDGFLVSQRGEFLLERVGTGKTRLTGTTWYRNRLYPSMYWRVWSDEIIHRIHLRVLRHIRTLSERPHPPVL